MFYVYKITNLINDKCYVGSTSDLKRRKREHYQAAKLKCYECYSYPLQKAIRKYGIENFIFSILQEGIETKEKSFELEREEIIKNNSLTNSGWGYNQTLETFCPLKDNSLKIDARKKCAEINGKNEIINIFDSLHDAARKNEYPEDFSSISAVCRGKEYSSRGKRYRFLDEKNEIIEPINKTRPLKTRICGINVFDLNDILYFDSVSQAAEELKTDRGSIHHCLRGDSKYSVVKMLIWRLIDDENNIIKNIISIEEINRKYLKKTLLYKNERKLIKDWAEIFGIRESTLRARLNRGWSVGKSLETPT